MSRTYDSGPPCVTCGNYAIYVVHDDPVTRQRNIDGGWAAPARSMGGMDYYAWAGVEYHPFVPVVSNGVPVRSDYERGYQAGYHAAMRRGAK